MRHHRFAATTGVFGVTAACMLLLLAIAFAGAACGRSDSEKSPKGAAERFLAALQRSDPEAYLESVDPELRDRPAKESAARILRDVEPLRDVATSGDRFEVRGLKIAELDKGGDQARVEVNGTLRNLSSVSEVAFAGGMALRRVDREWVATEWLPGTRYPSNGNGHLTDAQQTHGAYFSNPPSSGWHTAPVPRPGVYTQPKSPEDIPHFLEHGGVWILYTCPSGCSDVTERLHEIVNRSIDAGRPVAVAPYPEHGRQPPMRRINAVAWQYILETDELDVRTIQRFIEAHACRYNPEGGPYCSGVRGRVEPDRDAGATGFNARR